MKESPVLFLIVALIALAAVAPAAASTNGVMAAYVGVQGAWFVDADPYQADAELVGAMSASLSPHLSAVGGIGWGVCNSYVRGSGGLRVTVTDPSDKDFSIGIGCQYRAASKAALRPSEFAVDVSMGYRPVPVELPHLTVVGMGWYGLDTHRAGATAGLNWRFAL